MLVETFIVVTALEAFLAAAVVATVTYAVIRFWPHIVSWFQERADVVNANTDKIAFTLKEKMTSGECAFVQGIFNKATDKVEDVRRLKSQEVDEELRNIHSDKALAIYQ